MITDLDYIKMEYDGCLNDLSNVTISENDKVQTDRLFIDWSYAGKILQSDSPIPTGGSATFNDEVTLSWSDLKLQSNATKYGYNLTNANWSDISAEFTDSDSNETHRSGIFSGCTTLINIEIANNVTGLCESCFSECENLESIQISDSVTSLGEGAFDSCTSIEEIEIPDNVTSIGIGALVGCSSLTSVTVGSGVSTIGMMAFGDCASLSAITVSASNEAYCSQDGVLFNKQITELICYPQGKTIQTYSIPDTVEFVCDYSMHSTAIQTVNVPSSVTEIGEYAFSESTSLTTVNISNGLETIRPHAFNECSALTTISIPNTVEDIGKYAFDNCSSLASIIIPDSVTVINDELFGDCTSLASVTLPNTLTLICELAFHQCTSLTSITYQGTMAQWNALEKEYEWDYYTGNYVVHCTDGDVPKQ